MRFYIALCFTLIVNNLYAKDSLSTINKRRFIPLITSVGVAYAGSIIGLNELWYKNNPRSSFHFFNDNNEWMQVDKAGHFLTSFHESRFAVDALIWSGVPRKKAIWYGGMSGFLFQAPIEVLDGFSSAYGFSLGDLAANTAGSIGVISQYLLWDEIRIQPKISFHRTSYASIRPQVLGSNLIEQILKDYNGQTYWLSFNIHSFLHSESNFPKWLNISTGYGAENMIFAEKENNIKNGYVSYRQFYLALDIDFTRIKTRSKALNFIFTYLINVIHIPSPAVQFDKKGVKFHYIYF